MRAGGGMPGRGRSGPARCVRRGRRDRWCRVPGRSRRRCRSSQCADHWAPTAACHVSPSGGRSCSSARSWPRRRTRSLPACRLPWPRFLPGGQEDFFKSGNRLAVLRMMPGPCRQLAIAHRPHDPAEGLFAGGDAVGGVEPLRQIDQPPTHHSIDRRHRPGVGLPTHHGTSKWGSPDHSPPRPMNVSPVLVGVMPPRSRRLAIW